MLFTALFLRFACLGAFGNLFVKQSFAEICSNFVATPLTNRIPSAKRSQSHEYFSKAQSLVFGHRGMGISFKYFFMKDDSGKPDVNPFTENSIESFNAVAEVGGDGVESDIVLTRDFVPVLYHDFYVAIKAETSTVGRFLKIPVHLITYKELRSRQLYHPGVITAVETRPDLDPEMFKIPATGFPSLEEMLQKTNPKLAANFEKNEHDCAGYHNRSIVADKIIEVLARYVGERPIIISSFDFDVCLVFSSKQSNWPVAALTMAKRWTPFSDKRTHSKQLAANFAKDKKLWGISVDAEELIDEGSFLSHVRKTVGISTLVMWRKYVTNPEITSILMPKSPSAAPNIIVADDSAGVVQLRKRLSESQIKTPINGNLASMEAIY